MRFPLSLRSRVLLGAVLWTVGLFVVTGVVTNAVMIQHPQTPRILHSLFAYGTASSVVALVCMVWGLWHVREGLMPFHRLRARLSSVRDGRQPRVDGDYPAEVQPLVNDLNALLEHREHAVSRAVAKAGDLAHGLKTPLAMLSHEAQCAK